MSPSLTYEEIIDVKTLEVAWKGIRRGLSRDGLVIDMLENIDYEFELDSNLFALNRLLRNHAYRPVPVRELPVLKAGGLTRPVQLLDVDDAVVCQAVAAKIAPYLDEKLSTSVLSMRATGKDHRPYKGWYEDWPEYQRRLKDRLDMGDKSVVLSDVSNFYDNIDLRILKELLIDADIALDVADLITFVLDSWMYRPLYGLPIGRGVPQSDWDLPKALSNFYLYRHDDRIRAKYGSDYVRWADDMNIIVTEPIEGKRAIVLLNDSLRRLFLSPNSSKTRVLPHDEVEKHFWFDENDFLTDFERQVRSITKAKADPSPLQAVLQARFDTFLEGERTGNWIKVLRRYYTMFKRMASPYLLRVVEQHLRDFPELADKLCAYILVLADHAEPLKAVVKFLKSEHNMYVSGEIQYLEMLLRLRNVSPRESSDIIALASSYVYGREGKSDAFWYSRCLSTLLLAKYGSMSDIRSMARFLVSSGDHIGSPDLKRHLLAVAMLLPAGDVDLQAAMQWAKTQHHRELSRMTHFYETMLKAEGKLPEVVKRRLHVKSLEAPVMKYVSQRTAIVLGILANNPRFHSQLRAVVSNLRKQNEDNVMEKKLATLHERVS